MSREQKEVRGGDLAEKGPDARSSNPAASPQKTRIIAWMLLAYALGYFIVVVIDILKHRFV